MERPEQPLRHSIAAGAVAALVGYTSAFAVVLSGLRAAGASPAEASSGLLAVTASMGLATVALSHRHKIPALIAWSTPGAALLVSTGPVDGGWAAAVGAFLICGALIMLTGLWPRLGRLIASIPSSMAQAMLAGVLLELCETPVVGFVAHPWDVAPVVLMWLMLLRHARRWAVPAGFGAALIVIAINASSHGGVHGSLLPQVHLNAPRFTSAGALSLALPLYMVTMAGQNIPGAAILASYGYRVAWRSSMITTGAGTILDAFAGGHTINLAAITSTLVVAPEAHPDPARRWIVAAIAGWAFVLLALLSGALTAYASAAPSSVVGSVAGLALLGTLAASLKQAFEDEQSRTASAITFVVAASGVTFLGIAAAFWALLAGVTVHALVVRRPRVEIDATIDPKRLRQDDRIGQREAR